MNNEVQSGDTARDLLESIVLWVESTALEHRIPATVKHARRFLDRTEPAQPVEAVEVTEEMAWEACHIFYGRRHGHAEGSKDRMKKFLEALRDNPALIPALAHPRPTVVPEARDSDLHASAPDQHHHVALAVWEHMNRRSAPGVIMSMAYTAVLHALSNAAPTVEQAGEVVTHAMVVAANHAYADYEVAHFKRKRSVVDFHEHTKAAMKVAIEAALAAQSRPVGVPDAIVKLAAIECARRAYGYWRGDSTGGDSAMRYFDGNMGLAGISHTIDMMESAIRKHIASAPAPAKAGEV